MPSSLSPESHQSLSDESLSVSGKGDMSPDCLVSPAPVARLPEQDGRLYAAVAGAFRVEQA